MTEQANKSAELKRPSKIAGVKETSEQKTARIPIKIVPQAPMRKPEWIRMKVPDSARFQEIKQVLRENKLHTVCEEASCPNIGECFSGGTATFMILGDICTRRCPFCDVSHGKPLAPDVNEPINLARTIAQMHLRYVVITSVDRDDLMDGGAQHFVDCIQAVREQSPEIKIEVLVPDFRGRLETAVEILKIAPPDVMNHNLETVPRLYKEARPGADYQNSLNLLKVFGELHPNVPTKSGLMLGLGETDEEILEVMQDLRNHGVTILTLGQYLQPSQHHLPVVRFVTPERFAEFEQQALAMGFTKAACGPMVRSSYHADTQAGI
ncbi:lipoyl synthase [Candidatus Methylopumilus turicensis]|uniref:Lipoyl synthase n=1 Tax=Candidatus Methylopumilus turicensis TaxID=1581680 RepID=A0A0B7IX20_9PROT|nr:lipoyl synthase [Candidatus Methylopumilus turicensis]CEN56756.1 lipoate synthase [Candidatus Methylopumilus turicensis]